MIEVEDLCKSFGPIRALNRVSFRVEEGEVLGFLGPNGAGKSTTMRILAGFLPGDSGSARVAGLDVRTQSLLVRRLIGYLPEAVPLYPEMRVREYLKFRSRLKGIPRSGRAKAIGSSLEQAGVLDVERRVIGMLSRGYRQRVGVADALLGDPRVLILDEPTVGLDPEQVRQFRQLLQDVGRERTVILSTHILSEVEMVCSSVVIIDRGHVVAHGTTNSLRTKLGSTQRTVAEIAAPAWEIREVLGEHPGVFRCSLEDCGTYQRVTVEARDGGDFRESMFRTVLERGWKLRELRLEIVSLEDVFVDVLRSEGGV